MMVRPAQIDENCVGVGVRQVKQAAIDNGRVVGHVVIAEKEVERALKISPSP